MRDLVLTYLTSRSVELPAEIDGEALRFHPACPWREEDGTLAHVPALLAAFRDICTDEIVGVHRTRLSERGEKIGRRMLGRAAGAAIKLDADAHVTTGLVVGEGIETCLSARQIGLRPVWALGNSGAIERFPVLAGIEALTILAEKDRASDKAVGQCAERWHAAGREVIIIHPLVGSDLNDAIRGQND